MRHAPAHRAGWVEAVLLATIATASGCTSFATVRSAEVTPGASLGLQASVSTPPGDVAGWFWSFDCEERCDHPVPGGDAGVTYGWRPAGGPHGVALGLGTSGTHPYVDGYVQLGGGRLPFGVGARGGVPIGSWREHQLYGRVDVPLGADTRLLLDPALFLHEGRAPNGESPGRFVAFVQGVGLQIDHGSLAWTPAVALVAGRGERTSYGRRYGPERAVFATASVGVTWHRRRQPGR